VRENLFLVQAAPENVWSITRGVPLEDLMPPTLSEELYSQLETRSGKTGRVACWAMAEGKKAVFASMRVGDTVLISVRGTGRFGYRGTVCGKVVHKTVGTKWWPFQPGKRWTNIYFLDSVNQSSIPKQKLLMALGYAPNFALPGVIRVDSSRVARASSGYGSISGLLDAWEGQRTVDRSPATDEVGRAPALTNRAEGDSLLSAFLSRLWSCIPRIGNALRGRARKCVLSPAE